jgi:hypothetical protein
MKLVKCSAAVAGTRSGDSGSRKVRIWKGTGKERVVAIDRHGMKFPDNELPPEILADSELIVVDLPSEKPERQEIEATAAADVAAMAYADLVEKAKELGLKTHAVKKSELIAQVVAKLADTEKARVAEEKAASAAASLPGSPDNPEADKKGDRVQRDATEAETAIILGAEGVEPGDIVELESGRYRVVSMDDKVVIEPVGLG